MVSKKVKDGWHIVYGRDVYVENGKVMKGLKKDHNNSLVTAYPYIRRNGGWDNITGVKLEVFRSGVKRGTCRLM